MNQPTPIIPKNIQEPTEPSNLNQANNVEEVNQSNKIEVNTVNINNPNEVAEVKDIKISLIVLMGLPASGKTTLAQQMSQFVSTESEQVLVFNFDQFVPLSVQSELKEMKILRMNFLLCVSFLIQFLKTKSEEAEIQNQGIFKDFEESLLKSNVLPIDSFIQQTKSLISQLTKQNKSIYYLVIDDNNYYKSMRNSFYQLAKDSSLGFTIIHLQTPLEECIKRNEARSHKIPPEAIISMDQKQEIPDSLNCPCDIFCVSIACPFAGSTEGAIETMKGNSETTMGDCETMKEKYEKMKGNTETTMLDCEKIMEEFESMVMNFKIVRGEPEKKKGNCETMMQFDKEMIQFLMRNSLANPLERKEVKVKEICGESELQKADVVLRRWVNKEILLSFTNKEAKQVLALNLNARKNELLKRLREGEVKVEGNFEDLHFDTQIIQLVSELKL